MARSIVTRRQALATLGLGGVALAASHPAGGSTRQAPAVTDGPHALPPLPYPVAALEPHIDALTMQIHHDRHHRAYVASLNAAISTAGPAGRLPLDQLLRNLNQLPESVRTAVRQSAGGHANHSQFWTLMAPGGGGPPVGAIADALASTFGGFDTFRDLFAAAAIACFGSGWAWLSDDHGRLVIHSTPNQDTPSMENKRAILGLDVWEHAYYLQYQNRRGDYISAFWNVINWTEVNRRLTA